MQAPPHHTRSRKARAGPTPTLSPFPSLALTLTAHAAALRPPGIPTQTAPPSIPLAAFFPNGTYPEGEIQHYRDECAPALPVFRSCLPHFRLI